MKHPLRYRILNAGIALVWIVNGLCCKVLNLVPRHGQIVSAISGKDCARPLTILIGIAEMIMAGWILSGFKTKLNAIMQIIVIATMNVLEFVLVPELLLWGRMNAVLALMLIWIIYYNEFVPPKKRTQTT